MTRSNAIIIFSNAQLLVCKEEDWGQIQQNHRELTWPKPNTRGWKSSCCTCASFFFFFYFSLKWGSVQIGSICTDCLMLGKPRAHQLVSCTAAAAELPSCGLSQQLRASWMDAALPTGHLHTSPELGCSSPLSSCFSPVALEDAR